MRILALLSAQATPDDALFLGYGGDSQSEWSGSPFGFLQPGLDYEAFVFFQTSAGENDDSGSASAIGEFRLTFGGDIPDEPFNPPTSGGVIPEPISLAVWSLLIGCVIARRRRYS